MSRYFNDHYFSSGQYCLDYPEDHVFVPVRDFPDYSVCEEGYICRDGKILKDHFGDDHGHLSTRLTDGKRKAERYTHRIVAEAFIPNPNNYPIVRHLNDDPSDNRAVNLAWGTQKDNHYDSVRNGTHVPFSKESRMKLIEKQRKPVRVTDIYSGDAQDYYSLNEACRSLGIVQANACKVLRGERRHANGFFLEYIEKEERYD